MATMIGWLATALLALAVVDASSVTPVEKVTELLRDLVKKIEQEGKAEAAAYDKYACFCKEQADEKLYAIETSEKKIAHLSARISKLVGEISDLDGEIQALGQEMTRLDGELLNKKNARDAGHATFQTNVADASGALDSVERAIQALEDSKKSQIGKVELEAPALSQVGRIAKAALSQHADLSEADIAHLSFLAVAGEPGKAYTYKYKSNDIISTLENLRTTFANRKAALEDDEFKAQSAYELVRQDLSNQKKFAAKEKGEKEQVREAKAEEQVDAETDRSNESRDKASDLEFRNVLTQDCQDKALAWDQRSQTRADELTAISKAMDALKSGVAPNWGANKKLVGLQTKSAVKGHWVYMEDAGPSKHASASMSFLQVQGVSLRGSAHSRSVEASAATRVQDLLLRAAAKLHSPFLSVAALKVQAAEDHFVKVRQIIKDLIGHLEAQATAEETTKQFCDGAISAAVDRRDREQATAEDLEAQISVKETTKAQLKSEVAELSKQIAENKKALHEATQLRQEESEDNNKTIADASAGKAAVDFALETLKDFYNNAFIQRSAYVPPNSDREGLTVADRAPEVFGNEGYRGSQEAATGIIGILEVILSDFDRTESTVTQAESQAQSRFLSFEQTNTDDTNTKQGHVDSKNSQIDGIDSDLVTLSDSLAAATKSHKDALTELEKLHAICIAGVEKYEERVAQRNKEIEALKEAHGILENWQ